MKHLTASFLLSLAFAAASAWVASDPAVRPVPTAMRPDLRMNCRRATVTLSERFRVEGQRGLHLSSVPNQFGHGRSTKRSHAASVER